MALQIYLKSNQQLTKKMPDITINIRHLQITIILYTVLLIAHLLDYPTRLF